MTQYILNNPGYTLIGFVCLCSCLAAPFKCWAQVQVRRERGANIQAHGWPTKPYDADGDLIKKDDEA